eukprot:1436665-Alexandrium_andersonii.AAC.1
MSASLVGSEMCIRDSWSAAASPALPTTVASSRPAAVSPRTPRPCRRTTPVSYTHLTLPTICSV